MLRKLDEIIHIFLKIFNQVFVVYQGWNSQLCVVFINKNLNWKCHKMKKTLLETMIVHLTIRFQMKVWIMFWKSSVVKAAICHLILNILVKFIEWAIKALVRMMLIHSYSVNPLNITEGSQHLTGIQQEYKHWLLIFTYILLVS